MSEIKVNKISPRTNCGTVQLGDSGDTITIPAGATITNNGTQTGFGRTGTVDWQTGSIKTGDFTAVNTQGFFVDTNGGAVNATLPAGSAGAIISFQDYRNNFDTNALTITPNGSEKINGGTAGGAVILGTEGEGVTLVYIDSTIGWRSVQDNSFNAAGSAYVAATGGNTVATCGDFKIHTFTGPGTFCVSAAGSPSGSNAVEYIVVGGGASGGGGYYGGGGGAGGFRFASPSLAPATYPGKPLAAPAGLPVSVQGYPITVGAGGASQPSNCNQGNDGSNSIFSTLTAAGGGGGGHWGNSAPVTPTRPGRPGGSGGGAGSNNDPGAANPGATSGGTGNTPSVSPPQGNNGGNGCTSAASGPSNTAPSAGGGGAIAAGSNFTPGPGGPGVGGAGGAGAGVPNAFGTSGQNCGANYYFSGGGAGAGSCNTGNTGGLGGGGKGGRYANPLPASNYAAAGTANTGGGGGGMITPAPASGAGGSGIVIIRYKFQN